MTFPTAIQQKIPVPADFTWVPSISWRAPAFLFFLSQTDSNVLTNNDQDPARTHLSCSFAFKHLFITLQISHSIGQNHTRTEIRIEKHVPESRRQQISGFTFLFKVIWNLINLLHTIHSDTPVSHFCKERAKYICQAILAGVHKKTYHAPACRLWCFRFQSGTGLLKMIAPKQRE